MSLLELERFRNETYFSNYLKFISVVGYVDIDYFCLKILNNETFTSHIIFTPHFS